MDIKDSILKLMAFCMLACTMVFASCEVPKVAPNGAKENKGMIKYDFSFPASFSSSYVKSYSDILRKRLEFISGHDVEMNINKNEVVFSFQKGNMEDDLELIQLKISLLNNLEIKLFEVINVDETTKMDEIEIRPMNLDEFFTVDDKKTELVATPVTPFLVLKGKDLKNISVNTVTSTDSNNEVTYYNTLCVSIENNSVLEEKTKKIAATRNAMIYVKIGDDYARALLLRSPVKEQFSFNFDGEFDAKIVEMQYKFPLP